MPNPWLQVPLDDYEAHMGPANAGQLSALSHLFAQALLAVEPHSVAILGIAGGNGLEHIRPALTTRIAGIDIHPEYLAATRRRFPTLPNLELHQSDLNHDDLALAPFDLVHAALVFEHAGLQPALNKALQLVRPGGTFSVVLQLPRPHNAPNLETSSSLQLLGKDFQLIPPATLQQHLEANRFTLQHEAAVPLPQQKSFWAAHFRAPDTYA